MNSKNSGIYKPLDPVEIRILILEPGSTNSPICCRLITANLKDSRLKYKALSYEWGSPDNPQKITLNGKDFSVQQNLWSALCYLRNKQRSWFSRLWDPWNETNIERLWIDAICINQNDLLERGHQVSMMGSIYQKAEVICWLGDGGGNPTHSTYSQR